METSPTSPTLTFTSPAWPVRLSGISIFLVVILIYFFNTNVPIAIPAIVFCFMLVAIFFSSDTSVIADSTVKTLTVIKKRIIGSSNLVYPYDDIIFLCQAISESTNAQGVKSENSSFYITLKSQPTSTMYYQGRKPIPLPIPTSSFTALSQTARNFQEIAHARSLANFIGIPFYVQGSAHDTLVNTAEDIPGYINDLGKIPDALAKAKEENDRAAKEILGNK